MARLTSRHGHKANHLPSDGLSLTTVLNCKIPAMPCDHLDIHAFPVPPCNSSSGRIMPTKPVFLERICARVNVPSFGLTHARQDCGTEDLRHEYGDGERHEFGAWCLIKVVSFFAFQRLRILKPPARSLLTILPYCPIPNFNQPEETACCYKQKEKAVCNTVRPRFRQSCAQATAYRRMEGRTQHPNRTCYKSSRQ